MNPVLALFNLSEPGFDVQSIPYLNKLNSNILLGKQYFSDLNSADT